MTLNISKETETAINAAVQSGRYASADEMIARLIQDDARRNRQTKNRRAQSPGQSDSHHSMSVNELHRRWMASGLITQLPDPAQDANDDGLDDQPIVIQGEPLSETILRERR